MSRVFWRRFVLITSLLLIPVAYFFGSFIFASYLIFLITFIFSYAFVSVFNNPLSSALKILIVVAGVSLAIYIDIGKGKLSNPLPPPDRSYQNCYLFQNCRYEAFKYEDTRLNEALNFLFFAVPAFLIGSYVGYKDRHQNR